MNEFEPQKEYKDKFSTASRCSASFSDYSMSLFRHKFASTVNYQKINEAKAKGIIQENLKGHFTCDLCHVSGITGKDPLLSHLSGLKHKKKSEMMWNNNLTSIDKQDLEKEIAKGIIIEKCHDHHFTCSVCCIDDITGLEPLKQHLNGEKHKKLIAKFQLQWPNLRSELGGQIKEFYPAIPSIIQKTAIKKVEKKHDIYEYKLINEELVKGTIETNSNNAIFDCKACEIYGIAGIIPMASHLSGARHQKKVKNSTSPAISLNTENETSSDIGNEVNSDEEFYIPVIKYYEKLKGHPLLRVSEM